MKTFKIGAALAGATSAAALALTLSPASADVTSVTNNGTSDVQFSYSIDSGDPFTSNRCESSGGFYYTTASVTVSQTGTYRGSEVSPGGFDGAIEFYDIPSPAFGASPCSGAVDDGRDVYLQAGVTYTVLLTSSSPQRVGSTSYRIQGPGNLTISDGESDLSREQALTLCAPGNDVPSGYTLREGTAKGETLTGTAGKDVIRGLGGNDAIRGLGGDDVLCGGDGQDTIDAGEGNDFVFGEAGQDTLTGGLGDDVVDGGIGNDTLYGNAGADELFGGAGADVLDGGAGTDEGTDTDARTVFRNLETVNGTAPTPTRR